MNKQKSEIVWPLATESLAVVKGLWDLCKFQSGNQTNIMNAAASNHPTTLPEISDVADSDSRADFDTINYEAQKMIGHGSFGAVFSAKVVETGETVAIKKVLQDVRFKNRELQILRLLSRQRHPFIVSLKHYFVSGGSSGGNNGKGDEVYLNLVMEFVPETMYSLSRYYTRRKELLPTFFTKLYIYQLARALAHIHGLGICHRDIKPHNLLVDPVRQVLKLCDFGSAKVFVRGEPNVAYICSRFYRAPELIFGATEYDTAVDVWSMGCILAELLTGSPLFPGQTAVDQLVEIVRILGTPTKKEMDSMNPHYNEFKFPQIRPYPWTAIFNPPPSSNMPNNNSNYVRCPAEAVDLVSKLLVYVPSKRPLAIEVCAHACFYEVRRAATHTLHPHLLVHETSSPAILLHSAEIAQSVLQFTPEELSLASAATRTALTLPLHTNNSATSSSAGNSSLIMSQSSQQQQHQQNHYSQRTPQLLEPLTIHEDR